jgi:hypothetical protein
MMASANRPPERLWYGRDRWAGALLFSACAAILAVARWSARPPVADLTLHAETGGCIVLDLAGIPCPMCGMTTTFRYLSHGEVLAGFLNQPFGLVLFGATVAGLALGAVECLWPRTRLRRMVRSGRARAGIIGAFLCAGMGASWLYKIVVTALYR